MLFLSKQAEYEIVFLSTNLMQMAIESLCVLRDPIMLFKAAMKCALQTPSPVDQRKHCAVSSASAEQQQWADCLFNGPHLCGWGGSSARSRVTL
ncbi:hypothetical protein CEXT_87271 [Caerostris extrusa]|uniref:Uncharacterized protein n=1 Tax=Caerostris extrusa TaxID=172846 RepID=A0AAV4T8P2_CAEEX|nr:hypothetical protein CEXT_87271 [Caerostris extrusa]